MPRLMPAFCAAGVPVSRAGEDFSLRSKCPNELSGIGKGGEKATCIPSSLCRLMTTSASFLISWLSTNVPISGELGEA